MAFIVYEGINSFIVTTQGKIYIGCSFLYDMQHVLGISEQYVLYALGQCFRAFSSAFTDKPLTVSMSKALFIEILLASRAVDTKERALYRTLAQLEKKGFIRYGQGLQFSRKGLAAFSKLDAKATMLNRLATSLHAPHMLKLHRKLQARLKE